MLGRALKICLVLILAIPLAGWIALQIFIRQQPDEVRASIEAFDTLEFLEVLRDYAFPPTLEDRARAGRRTYPGRGHAPWVLRSALDGRPRMISAAIAPNHWVAYSTETAALHQFWRGEIDFSGPVYNDQHGPEPQSRGEAYLRRAPGPAWQILTNTGWQEAEIRWQAHGFDPESGALYLRYIVSDGAGQSRIVTERPEFAPHDEQGAVGLERRYALGPGPALSFEPEASGGEDASYEASPGLIDGRMTFPAAREGAHAQATAAAPGPGTTAVRPTRKESEAERGSNRGRLVQRWQAPTRPLRLDTPPSVEAGLFAKHDCLSCHNERERVVGPAWSEIALRYEGANREITANQLAERILHGSQGRWGSVAMTPHPNLPHATAVGLAQAILATEPTEAPVVVVDDGGGEARWTFRADTEPAPTTLHPSLSSVALHSPDFTPKVGGLAWLPDGQLAVATWDQDGAVFAVSGWQTAPEAVQVQRIAEGLHEPLGLAVVDEALYVMQKQEITQLIDHNGDLWTDEYRTITNAWRATSNFHEFGFGLAAVDRSLYGSLSVCVLVGGKSCREQTPDRGRVFRYDLDEDRLEWLAKGLRTPNGVAAMPDGTLLVTDNQGDWLPSSKLIRVAAGADYGWRAPGKGWRAPGKGWRAPSKGWRAPGEVGRATDRDGRGPGENPRPAGTDSRVSDPEGASPAPVSPPTLWLPQNEVGNSPTQPMAVTKGPYSGQILFGDVFNGGLKRAALEEVDGQFQGAAFHFSGGLQGPVHRLLPTPDATGFVAGQVGSLGNWGERGKNTFGLELLHWAEEAAFEPARVRAVPGGFEIDFTRPLADDYVPTPDAFALSQWYYVPSPVYGGPKYDLAALSVRRAQLSADRLTLSLDVPGLREEHVVYLHFDASIRSRRDEALWINEAWYTMNRRPTVPPAPGDGAVSVSAGPGASAAARVEGSVATPNTLTPDEIAQGWRLLFDGESFAGWKNYGGPQDSNEGWDIEDGALKFVRDVSELRFIWNLLSPFSNGALDLMTVETFRDFELEVEWKISEGGNSGIFYRVPDEQEWLSWNLALEMQVLDDARHRDGQIERHRAGDLYDLQSLSPGAARPAGEWNRARIHVQGNRTRHWLNGQLTADMTLGSEMWNSALAVSKFADTEGYAQAREGHITLQDHGNVVWFRNIKIRELPSQGP